MTHEYVITCSQSKIQIEEERNKELHERIQDHKDVELSNFAPGTFGAHEAVDRLSNIASTVNDQLLSHPTILKNNEWYMKIKLVDDLLNQVYNSIMEKHS